MEYIGGPQAPGCLFCRLLAAPISDDEENLLVARLPGALVVLNRFPYNSGHVMVAPTIHRADLADLFPDQASALMTAVQRTLRLLRQELEPEGFNLGINLGRVAGAGIPDHVHVHAVPRWAGDTNFMPVLAETKVVNEHLRATWRKLSAAFKAGHDLAGGGVADGEIEPGDQE